MKLPHYVKTAMDILNNNGFEAYVVGGAVRDYLLGMVPHDFDVATNATPNEVKEIFKDFFIIDTGLKHGTVTVLLNKKLLEITTYRYDAEYSDFRRPSEVHFIKNLKDDLLRRDFTINALCFNEKIVDLVGGISDLENKTIRAIGDASKRFKEDPLRILRALRFASTLDFKIEEQTKKDLICHFSLLKHISKERINSELSRIIVGKNSKNILLEYKNLLEEFVLGFSILEESINALSFLEEDVVLRLAVLCLNLDLAKLTAKLNDLKYSRKQIKNISNIISNYNIDINIDEKDLMKILKTVDYDIIGSIIKIKYAHFLANNLDTSKLDEFNSIYNSLKSKYLKLSDLKINGKDLIAIGYNEGIEIKYVLEKLLDDCISGLENDHQVLLKKAKEYKESN